MGQLGHTWKYIFGGYLIYILNDLNFQLALECFFDNVPRIIELEATDSGWFWSVETHVT